MAILSSFASVCAEGCVFEPGPGGAGGEELPAFRLRRLYRGRCGIDSIAKPEQQCTSGLRVWEVRNTVGAHAFSEREARAVRAAAGDRRHRGRGTGASRRRRRGAIAAHGRRGRAARAPPASRHDDATRKRCRGEQAGPPQAGRRFGLDAVFRLASFRCPSWCRYRFCAPASDRDGAILAIPYAVNQASPAFIHAATACGFIDGNQLAQDNRQRAHTRQQLLLQSGIALAGMSLLSPTPHMSCARH
jgi:hypothetical protein